MKKINKFLDWVGVSTVVSSLTFLAGLLVDFEYHLVVQANGTPPLWIAIPFTLAAAIMNIFLLDMLFLTWAKVRFDMFVMSGSVRRSGAKYERCIFVRTEDDEYFIPHGQELVLRNTKGGHAQVVTVPESAPRTE